VPAAACQKMPICVVGGSSVFAVPARRAAPGQTPAAAGHPQRAGRDSWQRSQMGTSATFEEDAERDRTLTAKAVCLHGHSLPGPPHDSPGGLSRFARTRPSSCGTAHSPPWWTRRAGGNARFRTGVAPGAAPRGRPAVVGTPRGAAGRVVGAHKARPQRSGWRLAGRTAGGPRAGGRARCERATRCRGRASVRVCSRGCCWWRWRAPRSGPMPARYSCPSAVTTGEVLCGIGHVHACTRPRAQHTHALMHW
jgi:hypothetical protein